MIGSDNDLSPVQCQVIWFIAKTISEQILLTGPLRKFFSNILYNILSQLQHVESLSFMNSIEIPVSFQGGEVNYNPKCKYIGFLKSIQQVQF